MVDHDRNKNGVPEIKAGFAKDDLHALFAGLPSGTSTVQVVLDGDLYAGEGDWFFSDSTHD